MVESIGMQQQQVLQMSPVIVKVAIAQVSQGYEIARGIDNELDKLAARKGDKTKAVNEVPKELVALRNREHRRRGRRASDRQKYHRRAGDRAYQRRASDRGLQRRASDRKYRRRATDGAYKRLTRGRMRGFPRQRNGNKLKASDEIFEKINAVDIVA